MTKDAKIIVSDTSPFIELFTNLSNCFSEINLVLSPEGIKTVCVDEAKAIYSAVKIDKAFFTTYDVKETFSVDFNLERFVYYLKKVKPSTKIELSTDETNINLVFRDTYTQEYTLPLYDKEQSSLNLPKLNFTAEIVLDNTFFKEIIDLLEMQTVIFRCSQQSLTVSGNDESEKFQLIFPNSDKIKISTEVEVKSYYSVEYLKKVSSGWKIGEKVILRMSNNYPLIVEYNYSNSALFLKHIIAPRIDSNTV